MPSDIAPQGGKEPKKPTAWSVRHEVPLLLKTADHVGPVTRWLRRRTLLAYGLLCSVGAVPTLLSLLGIANSSNALEALGWSLWLPGGGLLAMGGWGVLGFAITLLIFRIFLLVWGMTGLLALPVAVLVISSGITYAVADEPLSLYGQIAVAALAMAFIFKEDRQWRSDTKLAATAQARRKAYMPGAIVRQEQRQAEAGRALSQSLPELDFQALRAARYVFDLALQPVGQFEGFTRIDNIQGASLRYQLNFISYGLALLQYRYAPNFHGYLNQAQRFAIESLATPQVCGYWKYEYALGHFGWNPDPIGTRDNIMLTGWSLIALSTYAANTGDHRYQETGVLKFRPFNKSDKAYPHDAHSFVASIAGNMRSNRLCLYACEPHWTFSICNILAMAGLFPYDRVNGTGHALSSYDRFVQSFDQEFVTADGAIPPFVSSLTGLHRFSRPRPALALASNLSISCYGSAVHPGIARRTYTFLREEIFELQGGRLDLKNNSWAKQVDMGNYKRSPAYTLATLAQAAAEQGDEEIRCAALARADELLEDAGEADRLFYTSASTAANVKLATARWARSNDWHNMIHFGPDANALRGPILAECAYPDVLVARAISDGQDLDLVLYHGKAVGPQRIRIERLRPLASYRLEGALTTQLRSAGDGSLELDVPLDGRTPLRLVPLEG